jgi:hypothetical protein
MRLAREGMAFVINRLQRGRILLHSLDGRAKPTALFSIS